MRKVMKIAFVTPSQIGKVLALIVLIVIGAIVCGVMIHRS
jgi:hypothetical protein